jgi:hypothetical protein
VSRTRPAPDDLRHVEVTLLRYIGQTPWPAAEERPAPSATTTEESFSDLALRSFRLQCEAMPEYDAYARHLGRGHDQIRDWREIPPVPASAFRSHDLSASPPGREVVTFETSGTTISLPGRVRLASTRLYETSLSRSFERHLLPDGARLRVIVFGPTRIEAPRSSLWFMVERLVQEFCPGGSWVVQAGEPRWERADEELARAVDERRPVLLLGTTLLFQAYFERCDREGIRFALPEGSRAMDTGGAKGTRIEIRREDVESAFRRVLGIPPTHLVNEYGMAEMGSQFYGDALLAAHERRDARPGFAAPPWVRTRVLDPETMRERPEGEPGVLVHFDLANLDIPIAIQTEDVGALEGRTDDDPETALAGQRDDDPAGALAGRRLLLLGRLPAAKRRGCSLPFERFLERERVAGGER